MNDIGIDKILFKGSIFEIYVKEFSGSFTYWIRYMGSQANVPKDVALEIVERLVAGVVAAACLDGDGEGVH